MQLFRRRADHAPAGASASGSGSGVCAAAALPPSAVLPGCVLPGARPELAAQLLPSAQQQCDATLPIVYHPDYNITLFGIEKLHPFDSCKFAKVVKGLQQQGILSSERQLVRPQAVSYDTLRQVHAQDYLQQLQTSSLKVAQVRPRLVAARSQLAVATLCIVSCFPCLPCLCQHTHPHTS
jgi:histone deacetylase 11